MSFPTEMPPCAVDDRRQSLLVDHQVVVDPDPEHVRDRRRRLARGQFQRIAECGVALAGDRDLDLGREDEGAVPRHRSSRRPLRTTPRRSRPPPASAHSPVPCSAAARRDRRSRSAPARSSRRPRGGGRRRGRPTGAASPVQRRLLDVALRRLRARGSGSGGRRATRSRTSVELIASAGMCITLTFGCASARPSPRTRARS